MLLVPAPTANQGPLPAPSVEVAEGPPQPSLPPRGVPFLLLPPLRHLLVLVDLELEYRSKL